MKEHNVRRYKPVLRVTQWSTKPFFREPTTIREFRPRKGIGTPVDMITAETLPAAIRTTKEY